MALIYKRGNTWTTNVLITSNGTNKQTKFGAFIKYAADEDFIFKDFTRNVTTYSAKDSKDKNLKFLETNEIEYLIHALESNTAIISKMILTAA